MNNKCPQCDQVYNVSDRHVGRSLKCKSCGAALTVTARGIELESAAAPPPPPPPPAPAFDFGAATAAAVEQKTVRPARAAARDEDEDYDEDESDRRPSQRPRRSSGGIGDYLAFRKMVVPVIIQIIFWLLVVLVLIGGIVFAAMSIFAGKGNQMLIGLAVAFLGVPLYILLIRIYCEILIVIFRMNDTLTEIKNLLERRD